MVPEIFKIALCLSVWHVFMWQSVEMLNVFKTLNLKQIFWKTKNVFKKLEYCFVTESTKIEYVSFPYKTAILEANVKTNRMVSTEWTYHKKRSFASKYFVFLKILFESLIKSWIDVSTTQMSIFVLFVITGVLFDGAFSLWVSLKVIIFNKVDF